MQSRQQQTPLSEPDPFFDSKPPTIRHLRKQEWQEFQNILLVNLGGYASGDINTKEQKALLFTEIIRATLPSGKTTRSRAGPRTSAEDEAEARAEAEEEFSPETALAGKVDEMIEFGAIRKAVQKLMSEGKILPATPEVIAELRSLNFEGKVKPEDAAIPEDLLLPRPVMMRFTEQEVRYAVVKRMARLSSPGLDGWTRELFMAAVDSRAILRELTVFINDIIFGDVSDRVRQRPVSNALAPFDKGNGKIRPITPESAILKLASILCLIRCNDALKKIFGNTQCGCGGNVEATIHEIRQALESEDLESALLLLPSTDMDAAIEVC
jgi:hypothetical protein